MGIRPLAHHRWANNVSLLPLFRSWFLYLLSGVQLCPAYELIVSEWINQEEDEGEKLFANGTENLQCARCQGAGQVTAS